MNSWLRAWLTRAREAFVAWSNSFALPSEVKPLSLKEPVWNALTQACHKAGLPTVWTPNAQNANLHLILEDIHAHGAIHIVLHDDRHEPSANSFDQKVRQQSYVTGSSRFTLASMSVSFDPHGRIPKALHIPVVQTLFDGSREGLLCLFGANTRKAIKEVFSLGVNHLACEDGNVLFSFREIECSVPSMVKILRSLNSLARLFCHDLALVPLSKRLEAHHTASQERVGLSEEERLEPLLLGIQVVPGASWVEAALAAWLASPRESLEARGWIYKAVAASDGLALASQVMAEARLASLPAHRLIGLLHQGPAAKQALLDMCLDPEVDGYCREDVIAALIERFSLDEIAPTCALLLASDKLDFRVAGAYLHIGMVLRAMAQELSLVDAEKLRLVHQPVLQQLRPLFEKSEPAGLRRLVRDWKWLQLPWLGDEAPPFFGEALATFLREETFLVKQGEPALVPLIASLHAFGGPALLPFLLALVPRGGAVCREAAKLLGQKGDQTALLPLRQALNNESNRANQRTLRAAILSIESRVERVAEGGMSLVKEEDDVVGGLSLDKVEGGEISLGDEPGK